MKRSIAMLAFPLLLSGCGTAGVGAYAIVRDRCLVLQHRVELRPDTTLAQDQSDLAAIRVVCDAVLEEISSAVEEGKL